jgi:hypothetical protein
MRKFIYQSIVEKLKEMKDANDVQIIKHFDIWNNNLLYIAENEPFYTPAVFIEFREIEWRHQGRGVRDAAVGIVLHVITQRNAPTAADQPYAELSLEFFDLLTGINRCLHRHAKAGDHFAHDALTSTASATDHDFAELRHDIEVFVCHAQDASFSV